MPGGRVLGDFHHCICSSLCVSRWDFLFSHFRYNFRANGNNFLVIDNALEGKIRFLSHSIPPMMQFATYAPLFVGQGMEPSLVLYQLPCNLHLEATEEVPVRYRKMRRWQSLVSRQFLWKPLSFLRINLFNPYDHVCFSFALLSLVMIICSASLDW